LIDGGWRAKRASTSNAEIGPAHPAVGNREISSTPIMILAMSLNEGNMAFQT
jgi:hypothetical protein